MKLALLLIPLLFLSSCTSEGPKDNSSTAKPLVQKSYYDALSAECNRGDVYNQSGCNQSVEWMEKNGFREIENDKCPDEMIGNMNKTIGSKRWCEPNIQNYNSGNNLGVDTLNNNQPYYYELASSYCPEDGPGGCMESIEIMRHHGYKIPEGGICPIGLKVDGHTVPEGLTWCAPSDAYYTNLRKSCNGDTCCLSSVDAIEQGKYLETKDGTCIAELAPNMQRCLTSKQWCQYAFLMKDFGSGFTLEQTEERTLLYYYGKLIRDWGHTPPRVYPFIENEGCQELFEISMRKNPNPTNSADPLSYKKYIWSTFTPEEQKACMKSFYKESVRIIPYDTRFVSILWSNYQSYNITLYDILSGYSHDLLDHGDRIKKVDFENNSIIVITNYDKKKSADTTQYKTAFNLSFTGVLWTTVTD